METPFFHEKNEEKTMFFEDFQCFSMNFVSVFERSGRPDAVAPAVTACNRALRWDAGLALWQGVEELRIQRISKDFK